MFVDISKIYKIIFLVTSYSSLSAILCASKRLGSSSTRIGISSSSQTDNNNNKSSQQRRLAIREDLVRYFKITGSSSPPSSSDDDVNNNVAILPIEFISSSNKIIINGQESYDLNNLNQYSVFTPDFRILRNGIEVLDENDSLDYSYYHSNSPLYVGKVDESGDVEMMVSHDENSRINVIKIIDSNSGITTFSSVEDSDDNNTTDPYGAFLDSMNLTSTTAPEEDDIISMGNNNSVDNNNITYFESNNYTEAHDPGSFFVTQSGPSCPSGYRTVTVAIAFDTTFCNNVGRGDYQASVSKVQSLVGLASTKFQQLCLTVKLATIDGHCDYYKDPYKNMRLYTSGCMGIEGLLTDFGNYWDYTNRHLQGVAAHLFTGTPFDGPIGCSGIGSVCKGKAYGIESIAYSTDTNYQSVLFAHELGHNLGATHTNADNYVMSSRVGRADYGWDATNYNIVKNFLYYAYCI